MTPFMGAFLHFLRISPLPATNSYVLPLPPPPSLATGGSPTLHHLVPARQCSPQPLPSPRPHRRPRLRLDGSLSGPSQLRAHMAQSGGHCPNGLRLPALRR